MRILIELAEHRDICDECGEAHRTQSGKWCPTGIAYLKELAEQPEVERA
jgi:hypothetical protein